MPPIGLLLGKVDFSNLFINLSADTLRTRRSPPRKAAGAATLNYGLFLNTVVDFLIVAFAIFLLIKQMNRLKRERRRRRPPTTKDCPFCPPPFRSRRSGARTARRRSRRSGLWYLLRSRQGLGIRS